MIRVLFVCLGNICRSPMARSVFEHKVRAAGLDEEIQIDSAGTGDWHVGRPAHAGTRAVLRANNIPHEHRARQITPADLNDFDYVIVMDAMNERDVRALDAGTSPRAHVARLLDYAPDAGAIDVPDPYHTGGFDHVYALVDAGCDGFLAAIRRDHGL